MTGNDNVTAFIRTAIPVAWGYLISTLLQAVVLPDEVVDLLQSDLASNAVTALVVVAWYAVWKVAEKHLPAWLTRLVLGSNQAPTYRGDVDLAA